MRGRIELGGRSNEHSGDARRKQKQAIPIQLQHLHSAKGFQIVLSEALCGGVPKPHMLPREIAVDLLILAPHHERTAAGQAAIAEPGLNTLDC